MRVRGVHAHQHALNGIGLAGALGVAREPQVGRLHDEHAVLVKLETSGAIQVVEERGGLGGFAVRTEVEHEELVLDLVGRAQLGIARPRGDPQAALGVEAHLHGAGKLGELHLIGDERDLQPFRHGHVLDGFLAAEEGLHVAVGFERADFRQVGIIDRRVAALGHGPNAHVAVRGLHVALGHLLLHHIVVRDLRRALFLADREGEFRAATVHVVAVHRAIAAVPFEILLEHGGVEFGEVAGGSGFAEQRAEEFGRDDFITGLGEVNGVKRERLAGFGGGGE